MTSVQNTEREHTVVAQWDAPPWAKRTEEAADGSVTHTYQPPVKTTIDSETLPLEQEPLRVEMFVIDAIEALDGFGVMVDRSPVRIQIGNGSFTPEQARALAAAVTDCLTVLAGTNATPTAEETS